MHALPLEQNSRYQAQAAPGTTAYVADNTAAAPTLKDGLLRDRDDGLTIKQRAQRYLARQKQPSRWQRCPDCYPLPGDTLIGCADGVGDAGKAAAIESGGTIHCDPRCRALHRALRSGGVRVDAASHAALFIEALDRARVPGRGFRTNIVIYCTDRRGMLMDVATAVTAETTDIINVRTTSVGGNERLEEGGDAAFNYDVMVQDRAQLEALIAAVERVPNVTRVVRGQRNVE